MLFYQDLNPGEQVVLRRRGMLFLLLLNVLVLALIASYGFSAWQGAKGIFGATKKLEIAVNGEGKVSAKPDVAKISASIVVERESLTEAQAGSSQRSAVLSGYLRGQRVEERDIRTTSYNIFPQYSYPRPCYGPVCPAEERPRIVGYQVRASYEVTVRDIAKAGEILSGMVASGVNEVGSLQFTIDQPEALKAEARQAAIDDAREKAGKLAKDLGKRLGKITQFSESGGFPPPIFYSREALGKGGGLGGDAPAVEPGENEIAVNVSITYEFK